MSARTDPSGEDAAGRECALCPAIGQDASVCEHPVEARHLPKALRVPNPLTLAPHKAYPDAVQDFGGILYDVPAQGDQERFIDYALRIAVALAESGFVIVKDDDAADHFCDRVQDLLRYPPHSASSPQEAT